jgi:hypothetical protein
MLKTASLYAVGFAAVGVVNSLVQSAGSGGGVTVHVGLVLGLFVVGAIGGAVVERPFRA